MKYFLVISLCYSYSCFAQDTLKPFFERILKNETTITNYSLLEDPSVDQIVLKHTYAKHTLKESNKAKLLNKATILHVDYVYTGYASHQEFNQHKLNLNRLEELYLLLPNAFNNTNWNVYHQNSASEKSQALDEFKGFVIT